MVEVFPSILPSRLQEARQYLLSNLGLNEDDFGYFPSGGDKYSTYCSQVVSDLKKEGLMSSVGWVWSWGGRVEEEVEVTMEMLFGFNIDDDEEEVKTKTNPTLYNVNDEDTLIRLVATTPCFGKALKTDPACQGCPLFEHCFEKKGVSNKDKKIKRESKKDALQKALQLGYDLSQVKVPKSAQLNDAKEFESHGVAKCAVSGEEIEYGEVAFYVPYWGVLKKAIAECLIQINNLK